VLEKVGTWNGAIDACSIAFTHVNHLTGVMSRPLALTDITVTDCDLQQLSFVECSVTAITAYGTAGSPC